MLHPLEERNLTDNDYEIIRSFILPIQQNIPLADNPDKVTTVLLMLTCGMIENVHFGTVFPDDASFDSQTTSWGFELFSNVNTNEDIQRAALSYLIYLREGRKIDPSTLQIHHKYTDVANPTTPINERTRLREFHIEETFLQKLYRWFTNIKK